MTDRYHQAIAQLADRFGGKLVTSRAVREQHGRDESFHAPHAPDAVLFADCRDDVAGAVKICARTRTPVIPYAAGTSLEGHVAALEGGLCIDLNNMNRIVAVHSGDMDCVVEPGVRRVQLNEHLRDTGLFFPVDPGADASIGGMVSTRASGTNAVRYGTMRDNVISLEAVLPDGRLIRTARRARKSAAGYDLTALLTGAEGTLGVITEITLKLRGIPEAVSAAICAFPEIDDAVNASILTIQSGIPVARIELMDEQSIEAVNAFSGLELAVRPTLLMEFHGTDQSVREQAELAGEIARDFGGGDFTWTTNTEERNRLWQARHDAAYACKAMRKNCQLMATDVCVPISRLAECINETRGDIRDSGLLAPILGHVGDGNFHLTLIIDPHDPDEMRQAHAVHERMVMRAIEMDGTCTGEHGIGCGKMDFLQSELGTATNVMRALKQALDPHNIMNPGKIVSVGD